MAYLTYAEYTEFGFNTVNDDEFDNLITVASDTLDSITGYFYKEKDIAKDLSFRSERFKKAIAVQINYFKEAGGTTFEAINSSPQTFTAGRTTVSNASRYKAGGRNETKPLVAEEVYMYLKGTGLLYAGVDTI